MDSQDQIYIECKTVESMAQELKELSQKLKKKAEEIDIIYSLSSRMWEGTAADQYNYKLRRYSDKAKAMAKRVEDLSRILYFSSNNLSFADKQGEALFQDNKLNGGNQLWK